MITSPASHTRMTEKRSEEDREDRTGFRAEGLSILGVVRRQGKGDGSIEHRWQRHGIRGVYAAVRAPCLPSARYWEIGNSGQRAKKKCVSTPPLNLPVAVSRNVLGSGLCLQCSER